MERDGVPVRADTRKATALIAYLAVTGKVQRREALAALLWPEYAPGRAHANLRRTLWALNKAAGKEWVASDQEAVSLKRKSGFWLDVEAFRGHLAECHTHGHAESDICSACRTPLTAAVELYRDDFLVGFTLRDSPSFDEWQFFQAEGLRRELASALERLTGCHVALRELEQAITYARRWLAMDLLHEAAHRELMRLYTWSGQRAAALRQYGECARILSDELGLPPDEETTRLYEMIQAHQLPPPVQKAESVEPTLPEVGLPARMPHNLPPQTTPFVGRHPELAEIAGLIQNPDCTLLTLVGPGGIGKTRLALQAAQQAAEERPEVYPHVVHFVALAPLSSPEFLVSAIADALGFSFFQRKDETPKQQLLSFFREKRMLLVLDNFEHLVDGVGLLVEILQQAPSVSMLVTSRERLNLRGEWVLEIQGMRFPMKEVESPEGYSAIQLFLENARRADAGFCLSEEESPDLIHVCRLVDGMPLGLELAASWVRMLSCREIGREIERNLDFLTTSMRDVPERHRSLRAVFDRSWQLLSETEKGVFRRLSVFRGGFQREAARKVAGADLPLLATLVDKSLLRRETSGRYELHQVLREYAAEKLAEVPPEWEATREKHCRYFAAFLQVKELHLWSPRLREALDEIGREIENVRAAWEWAVAVGQVAQIGQAQASLQRFYDIRSRFQEGEKAFGQAVAALRRGEDPGTDLGEEEAVVLGVALAFQSYFARRLQDFERARDLQQESRVLLEALGARRELALTNYLVVTSHAVENAEEWEQLLQECLVYYEGVGDREGIALARYSRGFLAYVRGDAREVRAFVQSDPPISGDDIDPWTGALVLLELAELLQLMGEWQEARRRYEESLAIRRELGDRWGMAYCLDCLGYTARKLGNFQDARQYHQESLAVSREIGDRLGVAGSIDNLGLVALDAGEYEAARRLLNEGFEIRGRIGSPDTAFSVEHLGELDLALGDYESAARRFAQCLEAFEGSQIPRRLAAVHWGLGEVSCARGDQGEAWQHYCAGLKEAMRVVAVSGALDNLAGMAQLLANEGAIELSVELLVFLLRHHGLRQRTQRRARHLLVEQRAQLPPDVVEAAQERGEGETLEEVVDHLLTERCEG
jgi:predicted ATPase/DNA-binding SARP family transcriptional activator